jgi:alpha-galactosidase
MMFDFIVTDTDADGMPDDFELLHTSPASGTLLAPGDDLDSDGLTNLQEYQRGTLPLDDDTDNDTLLDGAEITGVGSRPPTSPTKADTDGDGLNDGVESNTGVWVSSSNRGTNPTKTDSDGDGLADNVETHTGTFVSETQTGTSPLLRDTDGDNAEDWYEVGAAYTNPTLSSSKPVIPYPLPDPDGSAGTGTKPVKVFILSGQSNMVGFGRVAGTGTDTLQSLTQTEKKFPNLITSSNSWTVRQDVLYRGVISALGDAPLAPGFGESSSSFGPELGFGHAVGYIHDEPVLIIKASIGNRSLGWDFLPPGSPRYTYGGITYAGYGDYVKQPGSATVPSAWYAGKQYDDSFLDEEDMGARVWASGLAYVTGSQVKHGGITYSSKNNHTSSAANAPVPGGNSNWAVYSVFNVCDILDNFATEYPQWASRGFEIGGFGWFHGWNDGQSSETEYAVRYEQNLVRLIKQLRQYYHARYPGKIQPTAPFVTVTSGFDGFAATGNRMTVVNAQLAVGNGTSYPEFAGNVKSMEGRGYWRTTGPNTSQGYHYWHNAETYMLVGDAMGRGMIELLETSAVASRLTALTISEGALTPSFAGDTFTYSANVTSPTLMVTPTLAGADISVNGISVNSGSASAPIPLSIGTNTITVTSTISGRTSTYHLSVTRLPEQTFATWQSSNGTTGGINLDHDNDGVPNGIEYFLGGNSNTTGFTALPDIANDAGSLSVTWTKSASYPGSYPADFAVESSPSLEGPWNEETLGGRVTITGNEVTYTFPSPLGSRRFVRLRVNGP